MPTYSGPLPLPPRQSTSEMIGTHGSYDGWRRPGMEVEAAKAGAAAWSLLWSWTRPSSSRAPRSWTSAPRWWSTEPPPRRCPDPPVHPPLRRAPRSQGAPQRPGQRCIPTSARIGRWRSCHARHSTPWCAGARAGRCGSRPARRRHPERGPTASAHPHGRVTRTELAVPVEAVPADTNGRRSIAPTRPVDRRDTTARRHQTPTSPNRCRPCPPPVLSRTAGYQPCQLAALDRRRSRVTMMAPLCRERVGGSDSGA